MNASVTTLPSVPSLREEVTVGNMARFTAMMRRSPIWVSMILPVLLTIGVGWVDDVTGWEVSLFVFYALPIVLAVWWSGVVPGIATSLFSGIVWWVANMDVHPYETLLGYIWALVNRECYFGVVVFAVNAVRHRQEEDSARIRMLEERRQLEQDIVRVSEHEQQRIGQDLHDGLCQQLAAIGLAVRALADDLQVQKLAAAGDASLIGDSIQQAVLEARSMARGIFPVHVDRTGLSPALQDLAATTSRLTGVTITVRELADVQIDHPDTAMHLYRIAQEAVANAVRHGGAQNITINLLISGSSLELRVNDDGRGMPPHSTTTRTTQGGMGLRTMRYRAEMLGARLDILPRNGGGTCVSCRLPLLNPTEPQTWPELKRSILAD
ncbi:MAG: sensor histidine kinase [Verrucomicrobiaceae bacterium]|nr:sensor histidine kinase [Verrucomicrobiaceae bacterium]